MAKKKVTKKSVNKSKVSKPQETDLDRAIREGDGVLVLIDKGGVVNIHNIKGVNSAVYAKGILQSALDLYLVRPVLTTINELHKGITLAMQQIINKK